MFRALTSIPNRVRHQRACGSLRPYALTALGALCLMAGSPAASAHSSGSATLMLLSSQCCWSSDLGAFCKLVALALFVFFMAALLDRSPFGTWIQRVLDWLTAPIVPQHRYLDARRLWRFLRRAVD